MSKVGKPRYRYIAFRVHASTKVGRSELQGAIERASQDAGCSPAPKLTRYEFPHGVAQAMHHNDRMVRETLARVKAAAGRPVRLETLRTSGTIRRLTARVGFLRERRKG